MQRIKSPSTAADQRLDRMRMLQLTKTKTILGPAALQRTIVWPLYWLAALGTGLVLAAPRCC